MVRPLHIKNAKIYGYRTDEQRDLYCTDLILDQPASDSLEVDLEGYTIFPGLINAHDHLELNHYPRTKFREVYNNAHEWGEDVNARLDTEPYKSLRQYPLWDKLFIGGLKNLLCGATTVAHHGPPYKEMYSADFPVRVVKEYGWAHSLHFDTDEQVVASYKNTPKHVPWFIHLAEGTDEIAKSEYRRLKALGCVGENTVIVHGIGLQGDDIYDAGDFMFIKGVVVCPTTNKYLLDTYPNIDFMIELGLSVMIGSDSRLTADGDIFDELHRIDAPDSWLWNNWILLGTDKEPLAVGNPSDFILVDSTLPLRQKKRKDIKLVALGGIPQIGDPDMMAKFSHIETVSASLDGVPKAIQIDLARRINQCKLSEPGLELLTTPKKRFFIF